MRTSKNAPLVAIAANSAGTRYSSAANRDAISAAQARSSLASGRRSAYSETRRARQRGAAGCRLTAVASSTGPETSVPSSAPLASIGAPFSVVRYAPTPSKFSSVSPIGSVMRWQPAHTGFSRCTVSRSRAVRSSRFSVSSSNEKSTSAGGSGTGWHNSSSRSACPRSVGELRPSCENAARKLICVSRPALPPSSGSS